jgi:hypothetical protein
MLICFLILGVCQTKSRIFSFKKRSFNRTKGCIKNYSLFFQKRCPKLLSYLTEFIIFTNVKIVGQTIRLLKLWKLDMHE